MTDSDAKTHKPLTLSSKTLGLKKGPDGGQVRQSFAHGRSKAVTVEVKKKRVLSPQSANPNSPLADKDLEARIKALQKAQGVLQGRSQARDEEIEAKRQQSVQEAEEAPVEVTEDVKAADLVEAEVVITEVTPENAPLPEKTVQPIKKAVYSSYAEDEDDESRGKKTAHKAAIDIKKAVPVKRHEDRRQRNDRSHLIQSALVGGEEIEHTRSLASMRRAQAKHKKKSMSFAQAEVKKVYRDIVIPETITVQELASRTTERGADVIKSLMKLGVMATINQVIDGDTAQLVAEEFGHRVKRISDSDLEEALLTVEDNVENFKSRPPVVTVMGHVDHGKTSLLDALRKTDVVSGEAGGITQHIGAYQVTLASGQKITFIDTPGHSAFTEMRARGANATDIVVLVVAADDGVMDQTIEAIHHARAAGVPVIVAINKIDKPDANPERVRTMLLQHEIVLESLGGDILDVEVSAKKGINLDKLEETILLQAEVLDLKADPSRSAQGVVIEAKLEKGRGAVATVLVQKGTLRVGDIFVSGKEFGRVRALVDDHGRIIQEAGPAVPVEVIGFNAAPMAGDDFTVVHDEAKAREVAEFRARRERDVKAAASARGTMDQMFSLIAAGEAKELAVILKTDVQGSMEALVASLHKLSTEEVKVRVLHAAVGGITESDVILAKASNAIVMGFNVRANPQARDLAKRDRLEIRYYSVIYDAIDDVKAAMGGLLSPTLRESFLGNAEIRQIFTIPKVGAIAGCMITDGIVKRGGKVRLLRDSVVIHEGTLKTLKRFKDEVKEVKEGYECGMAFENYNDLKVGDVIECFEIEEIKRTL
ncbi:Translation initiation factor IF-2 [Candidatus Bealeia paramacronuclearis]|uniref:Translation initiation factor IF-2 n=1 Tax=Candidatus Bealeia paramacronuclearis TaxID=1921001 RepID=A0ABZ2C4C8_9PROT|nr:Translation initiation factor IF-2 [Candidatus Bealeia paramacronuclearis]